MRNPRTLVGWGLLLGLVGAAGQLWLSQFGILASAPLRTGLSLCLAILIGVVAGLRARADGVKVAALVGVVAGAVLTLVGLGVLLIDPSLVGLDPLSSAETFLIFSSSILTGTVLVSWLFAGIAALVALAFGQLGEA